MILEVIIGILFIPLIITLYVIAGSLAYDCYEDIKERRKKYD